ncbi:MAG: DoxX family protein [Comamonas sp.]|uniref:DoxX family protein n=1 Tax=Comamonas sp. TaxID=34028 RepID=UPI0028982AC9|nr:DoxX family protein [Comamonas sp.]
MHSSNSLPSRAREKIDGLGLLLLRLWVGQEFALAGFRKLSSGWTAPSWFAGLDFPIFVGWLPASVNWGIAGVAELLLGIALVLGIASRTASLGLLFITYVAVYSVHFDLGWAGWNQIDSDDGLGFKVPLMLALMLVAIVTQGPGRWSFDSWRRP